LTALSQVVASSVGRLRPSPLTDNSYVISLERRRVTPPRPRWTIAEYATPRGEPPVLKFLLGLEGRNRVEATALLLLLRERGSDLRRPHSGSLGGGLFELRGRDVRVFYVFGPGRRIILLDGMLKKRGDIPRNVLARMRALARAVAAGDQRARER